MTTEFFEESRAQSRVKARIVSQYFWKWANVLKRAAKYRNSKLGYIDLFSGCGRYDDGTESTPLMVLGQAVKDPDIRERLVTVFVEKDVENYTRLCKEIESMPGYASLRYIPKVHNAEVDVSLVRQLEQVRLIPSLVFVDPCGYKGLSLDLVNAAVKDWGCECIFFFNYNRINPGIRNEVVEPHIDAIFGRERACQLRDALLGQPPHERERTIVEALRAAVMERHGKYVLLFRFEMEDGSRTSHYLVFVSKSFRGYEEMKSIMGKESSGQVQGVPSFEFSPAQVRQPVLLLASNPLDELQEALLYRFAGRTLAMKDVYETHSVGTPYLKTNYRKALGMLKEAGKLRTDRPVRKGTFPDEVVVTFMEGDGRQ